MALYVADTSTSVCSSLVVFHFLLELLMVRNFLLIYRLYHGLTFLSFRAFTLLFLGRFSFTSVHVPPYMPAVLSGRSLYTFYRHV